MRTTNDLCCHPIRDGRDVPMSATIKKPTRAPVSGSSTLFAIYFLLLLLTNVTDSRTRESECNTADVANRATKLAREIRTRSVHVIVRLFSRITRAPVKINEWSTPLLCFIVVRILFIWISRWTDETSFFSIIFSNSFIFQMYDRISKHFFFCIYMYIK